MRENIPLSAVDCYAFVNMLTGVTYFYTDYDIYNGYVSEKICNGRVFPSAFLLSQADLTVAQKTALYGAVTPIPSDDGFKKYFFMPNSSTSLENEHATFASSFDVPVKKMARMTGVFIAGADMELSDDANKSVQGWRKITEDYFKGQHTYDADEMFSLKSFVQMHYKFNCDNWECAQILDHDPMGNFNLNIKGKGYQNVSQFGVMHFMAKGGTYNVAHLLDEMVSPILIDIEGRLQQQTRLNKVLYGSPRLMGLSAGTTT